MNIEFISQGVSFEDSKPAGNIIIKELQSGLYDSFLCFVAFAGVSGINNIEDQLVQFKNNGGNIQLYIGVDINGTSKEALERLLELGIPTYIVHSTNRITYHPKVYVFSGAKTHTIIVGSSNLTTKGLFQNVESSICVSFDEGDNQGLLFEKSILNQFDGIITGGLGCTQMLDQSLLELLVANNTVLPEASTRKARSGANKSLPEVSVSRSKELEDKFGKIKPNRPPKGYERTVRKEIVTTSRNNSTVVYDTSSIIGRTMWIESGKMTGGSRNILDLSKKGKRNGHEKFGSVEFFLDDKTNYDTEFDIILNYNDKSYKGNTIKYTSGNSNWRIQLKGVTDLKEKLTDIFRSIGSQGKIFLFEATDEPRIYNFHILDASELDKLIDLSSDWACGGSGRGRKYGLISE